ncbi:unnamed protein product [Durusdinium trenchii]|uniref:Condensation domain-containing protein n=1 Tax=Durusdinium trenchii TaxID=1381693 RepID=A0ABP0LT61_9DINO
MLSKELKAGVDKLVEANPFLSARVVKKDGRMLVEPGAHSDCFFKVVDPPKECPLIGSLDLKGKLEFLRNLEQHFTPPGTALTTVKNGTQVFLVELMTFPEPFVCFVIHLSHLVGDAKTLYDLVGQLNAFLAKQTPNTLDWESPVRQSFELLPLSLKDRQKVSTWGFFGWLAQLICGPLRQNHVLLLSKQQIAKEKESRKAPKVEFLSSNDIITAALSRAIKNSYIMNIAVNMREKQCSGKGIPGNVAGNYWYSFPMDHQAASDPNAIRESLSKLEYYNENEIPCWPFFRGRYSFITSWTSFTRQLEVDGLKVECHAVHGNFLRENPTNVAVVFHAAPEILALSHNVPDRNLDVEVLGSLM